MKQKVNILGYIGKIRHNSYNDRWWVDFQNNNHYHFHIVRRIICFLYGPKADETRLEDLTLRLGFKVYGGCFFPEFTCEEDLMKFVKYIQNPLIRFQDV